MNVFGKNTQEQVITRQPTTKERELIRRLRSLESGRVKINIVATEPQTAKVFQAKVTEDVSNALMTNEELELLKIVRYIENGNLSIQVVQGSWTGEILKGTYIQWKF